MNSLEKNILEIVNKRLNYKFKDKKDPYSFESDYIGLHFDEDGYDDLKHFNYNLIKEHFSDFFSEWDLGIIKKSLWSHKGYMCFFNKDRSVEIETFGGWTSNEIIKWLIINYGNINIERVILKDARYNVIKRQKWKCNFCQAVLKFNSNSDWKGEVAHIDHIHPFSKRFTYQNGFNNINEESNLQALCPTCNLKKSHKEIN